MRALLWVLLAGCGGRDDEETGTTPTPAPTVRYEPDGLGFVVHVAGASDAVEVRAGSPLAVVPVEAEDGGVLARVDVGAPLEVPVEVWDGDVRLDARTALVLESVADGWGQPEVVGGLVNTPGWEDGANITPDGEWLFIQYLPVSPSCLIEGIADACETPIGPSEAPERPEMAGAERVHDGVVDNHCDDLGYDADLLASLGIYLPPSTVYGFHRQPDGTFADPFPVRFDGGNGCLYPTGPQLLESGELLFAWDTPQDAGVDTNWDFVTAPITLGEPSILGAVVDGELTDAAWRYVEDPQPPEHEGNPGAVEEDGVLTAIFFDDEEGDRRMRVQLREGDGWSEAKVLPDKFTSADGDIMPHWDGTGLWFRRGYELWYAPFTGAGPDDFTAADAWGAPERVLGADLNRVSTPDEVFTLGEPTITRAEGPAAAELYFVYGVRRADGWMDFGIGRVAEL